MRSISLLGGGKTPRALLTSWDRRQLSFCVILHWPRARHDRTGGRWVQVPHLLREWHFGMWGLGLIGGNGATCRRGQASPSRWLSRRVALELTVPLTSTPSPAPHPHCLTTGRGPQVRGDEQPSRQQVLTNVPNTLTPDGTHSCWR